MYASLEFLNLYYFDGSHISEHTVVSHYGNDFEFNMDKQGSGLDLAFTFTAYDGNKEMVYEPDYGEAKVYMKRWDALSGVTFTEVPFRPCNDEELGVGPLGFDDPKAKFYRPPEAHYKWFESFREKFNCFDDEILVQGDYNSVKVAHLSLQFVKCDSSIRSTCKPEAEIIEWLKRKFFIVLNNSSRFSQYDYTDKKIVNESLVTWFPVKSNAREEVVNSISINEIKLQDKQLQFSDAT